MEINIYNNSNLAGIMELTKYNLMSKSMERIPEYQLQVAGLANKFNRAIISSMPGMGVSMSALLALSNRPGPRLIVCPPCMMSAIAIKLKGISTSLQVKVVHGRELMEGRLSDNMCIIINYRNLRIYADYICKMGFKSVAMVEANYLKKVNETVMAARNVALAINNAVISCSTSKGYADAIAVYLVAGAV